MTETAAAKITEWLRAAPTAAVLIISGLCIACIAFFALGRLIGRMEIQRGQDKRIRAERENAVKQSRAVIGGQISEQLAPFLPDFPCDPGDVRFVGKPVDFIGFAGANSDSPISEILFIEVKTGSAGLSAREKQIKEAVEKGRVRYIVYRKD